MKTQITLTQRQTTLETLRSSGALFLWHPLLVDAALDLPDGFQKIESLVHDPSFARAVEQITHRAPSLAHALGECPRGSALLNIGEDSCMAGRQNITERLLDKSRPITEPFLNAMRRKALARMKLTVHGNRLLADEIDERLHFEFLRMVNRYIPGAVNPDGSVRTFGFKAFLETQLPYKLRDIIRYCMAAFGRNDYPEDIDQRLTAPSRSICTSDTANAIRQAIRSALHSPREVELLEVFLRENDALAEFAANDGASVGKIRREIEAVFVRAAGELASEGTPIGAPRLLYCRQALQDMMPSEELPRPSGNERLVSSRRRRFMLGLE